MPSATTQDTPLGAVEYLTSAETAALLRIKLATLHSWRHTKREGVPQAVKVGKALRYPKAEVLAYLNRGMA